MITCYVRKSTQYLTYYDIVSFILNFSQRTVTILTKKTDRSTAISVLLDIFENGAYANIALRKALSESELDSQKRAFITDIVNETLRNLINIDYTINSFSKTHTSEMKPFVANLLRISVCQIRFIEKVPNRATVNEAVILAKTYGYENLAGFVNAVLRNIIREYENGIQEEVLKKTNNPATIKGLALKYSYPKWLMEKLFLWLNTDTSNSTAYDNVINFCKHSHTPPPVVVLANLVKTTLPALEKNLQLDNIETKRLDNSHHPFLILNRPGDITRLQTFQDGHFFVIDPGAMTAVDAIAPKLGETIIDMCAAPGGKSFAMAGLMNNEGKILAFDIHKHRMELINQTKKRMGLSIISPAVQDATVFDKKLEGIADAVLVDAPCTGFGTIRKHPEIKYNRQPMDSKEMAILQRQILNNAATYLKKGGRLVYCTCTISTDENQNTITHFLDTNKNFELTSQIQIMPSALSDAFFVAHLNKK